MAYTTIDDPSAYFQTLLYTGNSSTQSVTFDGNSDLQPDWVWTKCRSNPSDNFVFDSNRGVHKRLFTNTTAAEVDNSNTLTSFDSDGFSMGNVGGMNFSSQTYVGWGWKCDGGTTSSNTDGSITSTVQANTTAGFSIVTYTGNATSGATIGHGLGVAPKFVITKTRAIADNWLLYHEGIGATKYLSFTNSVPGTSSGAWNNTAPSSTVVTLGSFDNSNDNDSMVAYCFAEKQGYSKFGSYTGNGNADGTFVYTGFAPAWVMIKRTDSSTNGNWFIIDNKRTTFNPRLGHLRANQTNAEDTSTNQSIDFLANGFKLRDSNTSLNNGTYIYMCFASSPLVSSEGVPNTAR